VHPHPHSTMLNDDFLDFINQYESDSEEHYMAASDAFDVAKDFGVLSTVLSALYAVSDDALWLKVGTLETAFLNNLTNASTDCWLLNTKDQLFYPCSADVDPEVLQLLPLMQSKMMFSGIWKIDHLTWQSTLAAGHTRLSTTGLGQMLLSGTDSRLNALLWRVCATTCITLIREESTNLTHADFTLTSLLGFDLSKHSNYLWDPRNLNYDFWIQCLDHVESAIGVPYVTPTLLLIKKWASYAKPVWNPYDFTDTVPDSVSVDQSSLFVSSALGHTIGNYLASTSAFGCSLDDFVAIPSSEIPPLKTDAFALFRKAAIYADFEPLVERLPKGFTSCFKTNLFLNLRPSSLNAILFWGCNTIEFELPEATTTTLSSYLTLHSQAINMHFWNTFWTTFQSYPEDVRHLITQMMGWLERMNNDTAKAEDITLAVDILTTLKKVVDLPTNTYKSIYWLFVAARVFNSIVPSEVIATRKFVVSDQITKILDRVDVSKRVELQLKIAATQAVGKTLQERHACMEAIKTATGYYAEDVLILPVVDRFKCNRDVNLQDFFIRKYPEIAAIIKGSLIRFPEADLVYDTPNRTLIIELIFSGSAEIQIENLRPKYERLSHFFNSHNIFFEYRLIGVTNFFTSWLTASDSLSEAFRYSFVLPVNLSDTLKYWAALKDAGYSNLTIEQQIQQKSIISASHMWTSQAAKTPDIIIDDVLLKQKLRYMCNREKEMQKKGYLGLNRDSKAVNEANLVDYITGTGPFANDNLPYLTDWDRTFDNEVETNIQTWMVSGRVDECMVTPMVGFSQSGERILIQHCSNCHDTLTDAIVAADCVRYASIFERMKHKALTPVTRDEILHVASEMRSKARENSVPERASSETDPITKVPLAWMQPINSDFFVKAVKAVTLLPLHMQLEKLRKFVTMSTYGNKFALLIRRRQRQISLRQGLPCGIHDANSFDHLFSSSILQSLTNALHTNDFALFKQTLQQVKFKLTVKAASSSLTLLKEFMQSHSTAGFDLSAMFADEVDDQFMAIAFVNSTTNLRVWQTLSLFQNKLKKFKLMTLDEKKQELLDRHVQRVTSLDTPKDTSFPFIPERIANLRDILKYLGEPIFKDSYALKEAARQFVLSSTVSENLAILKLQRQFKLMPTDQLTKVLDTALARPGFLYAIHCMDIAEKLLTMALAKVGPSNMSVRKLSFCSAQILAYVDNQPGGVHMTCALIYETSSIGSHNPFGPPKSSFGKLDSTVIPDSDLSLSFMFKVNDCMLEQLQAMVGFLLDNIMSDLQLEHCFDQHMTLIDDVKTASIISRNCGIWNILAGMGKKHIGSIALTQRYSMLALTGVAVHHELGTKVSAQCHSTLEHFLVEQAATTYETRYTDEVLQHTVLMAYGSRDVMNKVLEGAALDSAIASLTFATDFKLPCIWDDGEHSCAASAINEVFKGYQQSRAIPDYVHGQIATGNKIQKNANKIQTRLRANRMSCKSRPFELWALRGYTHVSNDEVVNVVTNDYIAEKIAEMQSPLFVAEERNINLESKLARMLFTGEIPNPGVCGAIIQLGTKLNIKKRGITSENWKKQLDLTSGLPKMIRSSSAIDKKLLKGDVKMYDKRQRELITTRCVRLLHGMSAKDVKEFLSTSLEMNINETKTLIDAMCSPAAQYTEHDDIWGELTNFILNDSPIKHVHQPEKLTSDQLILMYCVIRKHKTSMVFSWVAQELQTVVDDMIIKCSPTEFNELSDTLHVTLEHTTDNAEKWNVFSDAFAKFDMLSDKQWWLKFRRLFNLWITSCDDETFKIWSDIPSMSSMTVTDMKRVLNTNINGEIGATRFLATALLTLIPELSHTSIQVLLFNLTYSRVPISLCHQILEDKLNNFNTVSYQEALGVLVFLLQGKYEPHEDLLALIMLKHKPLKTSLSHNNRTNAQPAWRLPRSTRLDKSLRIAKDILESAMRGDTIYNSKIARVESCLYRMVDAYFGRATKAQLEKVRELPVKDEFTDTITDFCERICESLNKLTREEATSNPDDKFYILQQHAEEISNAMNEYNVEPVSITVQCYGNETIHQSIKKTKIAVGGNIDHSEWGPGHSPHMFMWSLSPLRSIIGTSYTTCASVFLSQLSQKDDEIASEMWHRWSLPNFDHKRLPDYVKPIYDLYRTGGQVARCLPYDMGQGMLHITSSFFATCFAESRRSLTRRICSNLGFAATISDQQGSDDRGTAFTTHALSTTSILSKREFTLLLQETTAGCIDSPMLPKLLLMYEYMLLCLDFRLSKIGNHQLSPKLSNSRFKIEMNSAFMNSHRCVVPSVRESTPLSKGALTGSYFQCILELVSRCKSAYSNQCSELTVVSIFLHKMSRLRELMLLDDGNNSALLNLYSILANQTFDTVNLFEVPLSLGGMIFPFAHDIQFLSLTDIEERKINYWHNKNSPVATLIKAQLSILYSDPNPIDVQPESEYVVSHHDLETVPRFKGKPYTTKLARKIEHADELLESLSIITPNDDLGLLEISNARIQYLAQLHMESRTLSGDIQKVTSALKKLKTNIKTNAEGFIQKAKQAYISARAAVLHFPFDIPSDAPSMIAADVLKLFASKDNLHDTTVSTSRLLLSWQESYNVRYSLRLKDLSQTTQQRYASYSSMTFLLTWYALKLIPADLFSSVDSQLNWRSNLTYPIVSDNNMLWKQADKTRQTLMLPCQNIVPQGLKVRIFEHGSVSQLKNQLIVVIFSILRPEFLTYSGTAITYPANIINEKRYVAELCPKQLQTLKTLIDKASTQPVDDDDAQLFTKTVIDMWRICKQLVAEEVYTIFPVLTDWHKEQYAQHYTSVVFCSGKRMTVDLHNLVPFVMQPKQTGDFQKLKDVVQFLKQLLCVLSSWVQDTHPAIITAAKAIRSHASIFETKYRGVLLDHMFKFSPSFTGKSNATYQEYVVEWDLLQFILFGRSLPASNTIAGNFVQLVFYQKDSVDSPFLMKLQYKKYVMTLEGNSEHISIDMYPFDRVAAAIMFKEAAWLYNNEQPINNQTTVPLHPDLANSYAANTTVLFLDKFKLKISDKRNGIPVYIKQKMITTEAFNQTDKRTIEPAYVVNVKAFKLQVDFRQPLRQFDKSTLINFTETGEKYNWRSYQEYVKTTLGSKPYIKQALKNMESESYRQTVYTFSTSVPLALMHVIAQLGDMLNLKYDIRPWIDTRLNDSKIDKWNNVITHADTIVMKIKTNSMKTSFTHILTDPTIGAGLLNWIDLDTLSDYDVVSLRNPILDPVISHIQQMTPQLDMSYRPAWEDSINMAPRQIRVQAIKSLAMLPSTFDDLCVQIRNSGTKASDAGCHPLLYDMMNFLKFVQPIIELCKHNPNIPFALQLLTLASVCSKKHLYDEHSHDILDAINLICVSLAFYNSSVTTQDIETWDNVKFEKTHSERYNTTLYVSESLRFIQQNGMIYKSQTHITTTFQSTFLKELDDFITLIEEDLH
jgi:hypothetical protein